MSADCQVELPELSCEKHEEADTRMFAHIAYSVQFLHHKRAVVVATDRCDHDVHVLHHTNGWAAGNEGEDDGYLPTYSCHHRSSGGEV